MKNKTGFLILSTMAIMLFILISFSCIQPEEEEKEKKLPKWASQCKLNATDSTNSDYFGNSVSISSDYAISGAYLEDGIGTNRGAAYIFRRIENNTWDAGFKITAFDTADNDHFGYSVSISGDLAIVGAPYEDGTGTDRGAAYIFRSLGNNIWDTGFKITAFDSADNDRFGYYVSISGDYAIVGAPYEDGTGSDKGAAYIFRRTGTNSWDTGTKITASDAADEDEFGNSVSISGDYAIVGAAGKDNSGIQQGAAYIYHRTGTNTWDSGIKITAYDSANYDEFGFSVSIFGYYAISGAIGKDIGISSEGAAYIFKRTGTNSWDEGIKITCTDAEPLDRFGNSVSISGDYAIAGAEEEDGNGINFGAAYILKK